MARILKSLVRILILLAVVLYGISNYFFYFDLTNGCAITIRPSLTEFSNATVVRAVKVLKAGSPADYNDLCMAVKKISPNIGCGGFGGGCFYSTEEETIYVSTSQSDLVGAVLVIVHETCHAMQLREGRSLLEPECHAADDRVLRELVQY